jgi:hypothetical protein
MFALSIVALCVLLKSSQMMILSLYLDPTCKKKHLKGYTLWSLVKGVYAPDNTGSRE